MGFLYSQLFVTPHIPDGTDFGGQTVIVTGSNIGLGKEAARHFAALNAAKVILAVRNLSAGEEARQDIVKTCKCPPNVVEVWKLDLSSYASVKEFAEKASTLPRLDVLLENAGIATNSFSLAEGYERTITVNVISTFLLALLLLPKLKAQVSEHGISPRVVIVSSEVHAWTNFKERNEKDIFATLSDQSTAKMGERYSTSKLLEVLVVRELAPKLADSKIVLNMLNPGLCHSGLSRDGGLAGLMLFIMKSLFARTTEVGSRNLVAAAALGPESHGRYISDAKIADSALSPFVVSPEGERVGKEVWSQLKLILESISAGVTKHL